MILSLGRCRRCCIGDGRMRLRRNAHGRPAAPAECSSCRCRQSRNHRRYLKWITLNTKRHSYFTRQPDVLKYNASGGNKSKVGSENWFVIRFSFTRNQTDQSAKSRGIDWQNGDVLQCRHRRSSISSKDFQRGESVESWQSIIARNN